MTSHEILKADVLDILFENRNKQYGAYALRKHYPNRLGAALALALTAVLFVCGLISRAGFDGAGPDPVVAPDPFVLTSVKVDPPPKKPETPAPPPAARQKPVASQAFLNRIDIVPEADPQDLVPQMTDLVDRQISSLTQEGVAPTEHRTVTEQPVQPGSSAASSEPVREPFTAVERMPEFPGGVKAWSAFLGRHLSVPGELEAGERRTVQVKFWVGEDGSVTRFEVVQSAGASFDNEVIRVLKKMPKWKPALQNGHPIAVTFTQPVTFQAVEE